jgi:hypothetical protein
MPIASKRYPMGDDMNQTAVRQALQKIATGFQELADAFAPVDSEAKTQDERDIELMLEFNRPAGQGLTQEQASAACKRHGYSPQTVGAWARGGWLVTVKSDGLRYLTDQGRDWITEHGGTVPAV